MSSKGLKTMGICAEIEEAAGFNRQEPVVGVVRTLPLGRWTRTTPLLRRKVGSVMTARVGTWLGVGFILAGASFVVAAVGAMGSLGVASAPSQWIYGLTGLVAGRLLLAQPWKSSGMDQSLPGLPKTH
jgi:hypothetical protein